MGYPSRQYHEGYWYHVYARSLEELQLFVNSKVRLNFLQSLDETLERSGHTLGAFCLMDTHYHALIKMGLGSLGRALQAPNMKHAKAMNIRHGKKGTAV